MPQKPSDKIISKNMEVKSWSLDSGDCPDSDWHFECRWCGHWLSYNDRQLSECPYCHKGDIPFIPQPQKLIDTL